MLLKLFLDKSKVFLNQNSIPSDRKFSKVCPNRILAENGLQNIEKNLRVFKIVFRPKINRTWSKLFQDISKLIRSPNSKASYRTYSEAFPNCVWAEVQVYFIWINSETFPSCVLAKNQLHLIGFHPRYLQNVS